MFPPADNAADVEAARGAL